MPATAARVGATIAGEQQTANVAQDFGLLRRRLLMFVNNRTEIGAIRAHMRLADRAFGELWAACSCNGDFASRRGAARKSDP